MQIDIEQLKNELTRLRAKRVRQQQALAGNEQLIISLEKMISDQTKK